jgi:hypothetical protein
MLPLIVAPNRGNQTCLPSNCLSWKSWIVKYPQELPRLIHAGLVRNFIRIKLAPALDTSDKPERRGIARWWYGRRGAISSNYNYIHCIEDHSLSPIFDI